MTRLGRVAIALGLLVAACSNPFAQDDESDACPQTYEFGNLGCAEVRGQVLGSEDAPLSGVSVGPIYPEELAGSYDTYFVFTDESGRFSFRIHRYARGGPPITPDTFSIYVRAAVRPRAVNVPGPAIDSVLTVLTLAPVGETPEPTTVEIRLDWP